ncbi:hypothetical protein S83_044772 [Arachis hypogaea]
MREKLLRLILYCSQRHRPPLLPASHRSHFSSLPNLPTSPATVSFLSSPRRHCLHSILSFRPFLPVTFQPWLWSPPSRCCVRLSSVSVGASVLMCIIGIHN